MREILFRGKRVDNGKWIEGNYEWYHKPEKHIITNPYTRETKGVIPETVGQYTGLTDKNGKKIFEGDIVRCYGGESCQGFWEYDEIVVVNFADYIAILTISELEYIEVIGNKWDNPELLKGEEE